MIPQATAYEPVHLPSSPPSFPESAWRGPFGEYRESMRGRFEVSDVAHFCSLWAVAGATLRRQVYFYYAGQLFPNTYNVFFSPTGEGKSVALRKSFSLLGNAVDYVKTMSGIGSAEGLGDWMSEIGLDKSPSFLIWLEELGALLIRGGWEGSTLLTMLTEIFDCPSVYEARFRKKPIKIIEPTLSILSATTPEWFWKSMKEDDFHGGFGNRLLFFTGPIGKPIPLPPKPQEENFQNVQEAIANLGKVQEGEMAFDDQAHKQWNQFYLDWRVESGDFDPLVRAAIKRIPAYAIKLAMVYAAFEGTAPGITLEQLSAAIDVVLYNAKCAEILISKQHQHAPRRQCEEAVVRVLTKEKLPGWKVHHRIGGRFSADEFNRALLALTRAGVVIKAGSTSRGEPVFRLKSEQPDP